MLSKLVGVVSVIGRRYMGLRTLGKMKYGTVSIYKHDGVKVESKVEGKDISIKSCGLNYVNSGEKFDASRYSTIKDNYFIFSKDLGRTDMHEYDNGEQHVLCYESKEGTSVSSNVDKKNGSYIPDNRNLYMNLGWMLVDSYKYYKDPKYEDGGPYTLDKLHTVINKFVLACALQEGS